MYEPGSLSRKLINDLMDTAYLVNVVHNDFRDPSAIFKPFFLAGEGYRKRRQQRSSSTPNAQPEQKVMVNGIH